MIKGSEKYSPTQAELAYFATVKNSCGTLLFTSQEIKKNFQILFGEMAADYVYVEELMRTLDPVSIRKLRIFHQEYAFYKQSLTDKIKNMSNASIEELHPGGNVDTAKNSAQLSMINQELTKLDQELSELETVEKDLLARKNRYLQKQKLSYGVNYQPSYEKKGPLTQFLDSRSPTKKLSHN